MKSPFQSLGLLLALLCPLSARAQAPGPPESLVALAPEVEKYQLVYSLDIGPDANYSTTPPPYFYDYRSVVTLPFSRIAYFLELTPTTGPKQWVYVSMDAFTSDINQVGVPTPETGAYFSIPVDHLTVYSSETNVVTGRNMLGGNIEFGPGNYTAGNNARVPGASNELFDWGDVMSLDVGYGSMQVHNHFHQHTIFAFNGFCNNVLPALGIGNQLTGCADWSLANNLRNYNTRKLQVFVLPGPALIQAVSDPFGQGVTLVFNQPLRSDSILAEHFSLGPEIQVKNAVLNRETMTHVSLKTSELPATGKIRVDVRDVVAQNGGTVVPGSFLEFERQEAPTAYLVRSGTYGEQSFNYVTGMDFEVHSSIAVTHLGVFDNLSTTLPGLLTEADNLPIVASIYERNTATLLVKLSFGPGTPGGDGILVGGSRFKPLPEPLTLQPGSYSIVGDYYGRERMGNSGGAVPIWLTNSFRGYLSFGGVGRFLDQRHDTFPTTLDGGPANRYATATFQFKPLPLNPPPPPPNLRIFLEDQSVIVSWPLEAEGFYLEERLGFEDGTFWQQSIEFPVTTPEDFRVVFPAPPDPFRFFRLVK